MAVRRFGYNELDRALGKTPGYTSTLMKRNARPRSDSVAKLAEVLGVRSEFLLNGDDPMLDPSTPMTSVVDSVAKRRRRTTSTTMTNTPIDNCPSRAIVVAMARALDDADAGSRGITEGAIAALLAERREDGDPGVQYWYEHLKKYIEMSRGLRSTINGTDK